MNPTVISDIDHLKSLADHEDNHECFIMLSLGRSSKLIRYFPEDDAWWVLHEIDDSEGEYNTTEEMLSQTNIGEALEKGAMYSYNWEEA